jgi:hypothetical protein
MTLTVALLLSGWTTGAQAEAERGRVGLTVFADGDRRVGPVVSFRLPLLNSFFAIPIIPEVAIDEGGRLFTLGVLRSVLAGSQQFLFFADTNCDGPPLMATHGDVLPQTLVRLPELTVLIEQAGTTPVVTAVQSKLQVDPFTLAEVCQPDVDDVKAVPAVILGDLSQRFPPPYTVR